MRKLGSWTQIDTDCMDTCGNEDIPVYLNNEFGMFGQLPESSESSDVEEPQDCLIGENRRFGGKLLYKDLIPSTMWFTNVRSCVSRSSWDELRKRVYERVDYKCECCNTDCRIRKPYTGDDYEDNVQITPPSSEFKADVELNKWNTIQLEAHERWSYDYESKTQKLERVIALCHRCHSATHLGLADIRGVKQLALKHMKKVNKWADEQLLQHLEEQSKRYRERSIVKWHLNIDIVTNSGFQVIRKTKSQ